MIADTAWDRSNIEKRMKSDEKLHVETRFSNLKEVSVKELRMNSMAWHGIHP